MSTRNWSPSRTRCCCQALLSTVPAELLADRFHVGDLAVLGAGVADFLDVPATAVLEGVHLGAVVKGQPCQCAGVGGGGEWELVATVVGVEAGVGDELAADLAPVEVGVGAIGGQLVALCAPGVWQVVLGERVACDRLPVDRVRQRVGDDAWVDGVDASGAGTELAVAADVNPGRW